MSSKHLPAMFASYAQTLVYYDGPQVALFKNRKGTPILAIASPEPIGDLAEPFLANAITPKILDDYMGEKIDLNYAMRYRRGGGHYVFDWQKVDSEVRMQRAEKFEVELEDIFPESGFFARCHTEPYIGHVETPLYRHSYSIDGKWTASDFSKFYAKLSDLYALFSLLSEMSGTISTVSLDLSSIIKNYPFQGGGSYLSMFKEVIQETNDNYPLQVSKIKYASPGEIELRGINSSLSRIDSLILLFDHENGELREIYSEIRAILKKENLLGSKETEFSNAAIEKSALSKSDKLLSIMHVENASLRKACGNQTAIYAKIALAIYRRGRELHLFHAEGRMQLPT